MKYNKVLQKHLKGKSTESEKEFLLNQSLKVINNFLVDVKIAEYVKKYNVKVNEVIWMNEEIIMLGVVRWIKNKYCV